MREITQQLQRMWAEIMLDPAFRKKLAKQSAEVDRRRAELEKGVH